MIWLAWRQFRKQALFTVIGLAVLAALMIPTGLAMHHSFDDLGFAVVHSRVGLRRAGAGSQRELQLRVQTIQRRVQTRSAGCHSLHLPAAVRGVVLGCAADFPGTRTRHPPAGLDPGRQPPALGAGQVHADRRLDPRRRDRLRAWVVLVAEPGEPDRVEPFQSAGFRPAGGGADRLHAVRGRAGYRRRHDLAEGIAGHGGHPGRIRRPADRPHPAGQTPLPAPRDAHLPVQADAAQNNPYSGDWVQSQEIRDAAGNVVLDNAQAACTPGATSCGPGLEAATTTC